MILYKIIGGKQMKASISIGDIRQLNIKVILNDTNVIYEGAAENAPAEIKKITYSKAQIGSPSIFYIYDN